MSNVPSIIWVGPGKLHHAGIAHGIRKQNAECGRLLTLITSYPVVNSCNSCELLKGARRDYVSEKRNARCRHGQGRPLPVGPPLERATLKLTASFITRSGLRACTAVLHAQPVRRGPRMFVFTPHAKKRRRLASGPASAASQIDLHW